MARVSIVRGNDDAVDNNEKGEGGETKTRIAYSDRKGGEGRTGSLGRTWVEKVAILNSVLSKDK